MNHLLAAEPDEPDSELWNLKVLKNNKCGSASGGDGKVADFYQPEACVLHWRVDPVEARRRYSKSLSIFKFGGARKWRTRKAG